MSKPTIKVKKDEENPEPIELLAKSIIQVSDGFERILNGGLNQKAIVVLLQNGIGTGKITQKQIELVLDQLKFQQPLR